MRSGLTAFTLSTTSFLNSGESMTKGAGRKGVLYLLDEPTTGLHLRDVQILWNLLRRLSSQGNTVILIEHHPDVIRLSDYLVELGPSGGDEGGFVTYMGVPADKNA